MGKSCFSSLVNQVGTVLLCLSHLAAIHPVPFKIDLKNEETFLLSFSDEDRDEETISIPHVNSESFNTEQTKPQRSREQGESDPTTLQTQRTCPYELRRSITVGRFYIHPQSFAETLQIENSTTITSEEPEDDPQIGKVTLKTIYYNGTEFSDQNYDYDKLKSEYYDQISGDLALSSKNVTRAEVAPRNWLLRKGINNWQTVLKWMLLAYAVLVVPLWCWRGWCLCCFQCQFCYPDEIVWEAKRYAALNPPGVILDAEGKEIKYTPSRYEEQSYTVLKRSIHRYAA